MLLSQYVVFGAGGAGVVPAVVLGCGCPVAGPAGAAVPGTAGAAPL